LNIDPFAQHPQSTDLDPGNVGPLKTGDLFIWDNHFSLIDLKIQRETFDQDTTFTSILNKRVTENKRTVEYVVYRKK
jgi:hypothetical protein